MEDYEIKEDKEYSRRDVLRYGLAIGGLLKLMGPSNLYAGGLSTEDDKKISERIEELRKNKGKREGSEGKTITPAENYVEPEEACKNIYDRVFKYAVVSKEDGF
ncbi:MAG TPA: hypothetical protein ENG87_04065, partial [Candidatus Pacearchaeota archaeon]|nr:hypothetical protein [Candidatus Pacearchaeota archaeon]